MFNPFVWIISLILWAGGILFAMGCWSLVHGADSIGLAKTNVILNYNLTTQWSAIVNLVGGNGGPRNYAGLFADSSPTAVRLDWLYLDNTKDVTNTKRNLTAGTVTFPGLTAPSYEIRLFNWTAIGAPGTQIATMAVFAPQIAVERRDLAIEGKVSIQRVPVGNRDQVKISLGNSGDQEWVTMDRGVVFTLKDVTEVAAPAASPTP